jgi:hypothetical protein
LHARIGSIHQDRYRGRRRDQFFKQLQAFSNELWRYQREAREICAGSCEAVDKSCLDGIGMCVEDDWRRASVLRGNGCLRPKGEDDVEIQLNQFGHEPRETLGHSFCPSVLDQDVLALDIAKFPHAFPERRVRWRRSS